MFCETVELMNAAVARVKESLIADNPVAVLILEHPDETRTVLIDYDSPWSFAAQIRFERRAVERATGTVGWALAVPQVWAVDGTSHTTRALAPHGRLRDGEYEAITWSAFDETGLDVGWVKYCRVGGHPMFEDTEIINSRQQVQPGFPGFTLMQEQLAASEQVDGT
jgi:hypothetical protein